MLMFSGTLPKEVQNLADILLNDYLLIYIGSIQLQDHSDHLQAVDVGEDETTEPR